MKWTANNYDNRKLINWKPPELIYPCGETEKSALKVLRETFAPLPPYAQMEASARAENQIVTLDINLPDGYFAFLENTAEKCTSPETKHSKDGMERAKHWVQRVDTPEGVFRRLADGYGISLMFGERFHQFIRNSNNWRGINGTMLDIDVFRDEKHPDAPEPVYSLGEMLNRYPLLARICSFIMPTASSLYEGRSFIARGVILFPAPITDQRVYHAFGDILLETIDCIPANVTKNPCAVGFGNTHNVPDALGFTPDTTWIQNAIDEARQRVITENAEKESKRQKAEARRQAYQKKQSNGTRTGDRNGTSENISAFIEQCDPLAEMLRDGLLTPAQGSNRYKWHKSDSESSCEWVDGKLRIYSASMQDASPSTGGENAVNAHRFYLYHLTGLDLSKDSDKPKCREYLFEQGYGSDPKQFTQNVNFVGDPPKWTEADIETEDTSPQLADFPSELFFGIFGTYREAHLGRVPMSDAFCFASLKHCISSTLGRKYYIDSEPEIFPNFYTALIGDSSDAAKGIALRQQAKMLRSIDPTVHTIKSLTTPAGLVNLFVEPVEKERTGEDRENETYYIGGLADRITDTDFLENMISNCCCKESFRISCQLGEFRDLLIKSARSTGAGLLELIMDIYDADEVIDSNTKVDASLAKYPTLSMIGGTDKRLIEKALGAEYIGGGLTNRFEWYLGHEVEERFINQKAESTLWGKCQTVLGNIRNKFDETSQQVAFTIPRESEALGEDFLKQHKQHLKLIRDDEELAADSLRRTKMHVLKNSLIFSVLCNEPNDTAIHPEQMEKAILLANWTTNATQHIFNDFALGEDSNLKKRLLKLLTSKPRMSASQIGNRLRSENPTKLFQMLEVLTRHEVLIREVPKRTALYSVRKLSAE